MRRLISAAAALLVLTAAACTDDEAAPAAAECEPGEFTVVDEESLGEYAYSLSFPCVEGEELATVIVLHGRPGTGLGIRTDSNMDELAEEHGFMAVYPSQPAQQWDAAADGDDVAFISNLIDTLVEDWSADPDRIYVAGFSNGGDMSLAVGAALPDKVNAIAPVAPAGTGSVYEAVEGLETPVPMVAFVGANDTQFGDPGRRGLDLWLQSGECSSSGTDEQEQAWELESWQCAGETPAQIYLVEGGHQWFGAPDRPEPLWASQVMWDFFTDLESQ